MAETTPETCVFFHTETLGLDVEKNRITQLSFVSVAKLHIRNNKIPRIKQKLTLSFNTEKSADKDVSGDSQTGLSKGHLNDLPTFSDQASMIIDFINALPKPVGLLAHNGDEFTFPQFVKQLKECGVEESKLSDVVCADTKPAFQTHWSTLETDSLGAVYRHVFGRDQPAARSAECNSIALMELVCSKNGNEILDLMTWKPIGHYMKEK